MSFSLLQNSLTITHRALPLAFHFSSLIRDIIQTLLYTPNMTSPLPEQKNSLWTLTTYRELRQQIVEAQKRYQGPADSHRTSAPNFGVGQQVFVKATYFRTTRPSKKLLEKNLGPFKIIAQVGPASFTLRLPKHMKAVHPVFHVSQLELSTPNTILNRIQPPPP